MTESGVYNMLGGKFWFGQYEDETQEYNYMFSAWDINGDEISLDLEDIGLGDLDYPVFSEYVSFNEGVPDFTEYYRDIVNINNSEGIINSNIIVLPPGVTNLKISRANYLLGQDGLKFYASTIADITFINQSEALNFGTGHWTNEDECVTYDNFRYFSSNDLDGFCGKTSYTLRKREDNITDPSDPQNNILLGIRTDRSHDLPESWDEDCFDPNKAPYSSPRPSEPVPWDCETFCMDLVIEPCRFRPGYEHCENIEITKEISICCTCDARQAVDEI
jgi:hypothetical protein